MCLETCHQKTSIKMQSGESMKTCANHKPMTCGSALILQASDKEVEVWMNGTMQCKQKSILLNTPRNSQDLTL